MNVLASYLLVQVALLAGQTMPPPPTAMPPDFPTKIWVQDSLRETVARMWSTSPTFHHQCLRVQQAGAIQVQLRLDPALAQHPTHRAICEMRIYSSGAIIAQVNVSPVSVEELIGHEMEHICERLDGVKVEEEARRHRDGYYVLDSSHGRYETERAIRVGRQVMAEMNVTGNLTRTQ
jgi:hypothetical protein